MHNGNVTIKVIGVGGGGGNAVSHIARHMNHGVEFAAVNTDLQALSAADVPLKLQIGAQVTQGFGSGARPEIGRQAAEESIEDIRALLRGTDLVFIAAGLGGGTGTGASPVIAKIAREEGALTIAVVTRPFTFEGNKRAEAAAQGCTELKQIADSVICIPNDRVLKASSAQLPVHEAFRMTDAVLCQVVSSISELISHAGIINIDYGDIATIMREPGDLMVGFGEAAGEDSAVKAVRYAMASPLLERSDIVGAKQVLISIVGGLDLTMKDVQEAVQTVHNEIRGEAHIVFGVITREELEGKARVTLVASGLPEQKRVETRKMKEVPAKSRVVQNVFDFLPAETGRFVGIEPTLINGVNYDTPTFLRWGRKLLSDAA